MAKVTSKLQVTIPKALADQYDIKPGDEIEFRPAGSQIRVVPARAKHKRLSTAERLRLFEEATARQREREKRMTITEPTTDRGWTREELYTRGTPLVDESDDDDVAPQNTPDNDGTHEDVD